MTTFINSPEQSGAMILRIALGIMWISHALLKWFVFTIPGSAGFLESQGLPAILAWPVFLLELGGGLLILAGVYGRYVSALLIPVLLVATWTHVGNGWVHTSAGGGWEYPIFLAVASLVHVLLGDGRPALYPGRDRAHDRSRAGRSDRRCCHGIMGLLAPALRRFRTMLPAVDRPWSRNFGRAGRAITTYAIEVPA